MKRISILRFNSLAGYARDPRSAIIAEEVGWFEHANERVLGLLIRDRIDNDYAGVVLARDELMQYRWTRMTDFSLRQCLAKMRLRRALKQAAAAPDKEHHQGHVRARPVDFFTPVVERDRLHPDFELLITQEGYSPARGIIEPMMRWYEDVDGNFVEQFQTTAFDARLWELYLYATMVEMGFSLDRSERAPDFVATSLWGKVAIEATSVNPTKGPDGETISPPSMTTKEEWARFRSEYMPIKFGSALYSKLVKEDWTKSHVKNIPFAIAVQDFSAPGSMVFTRSSLEIYLYGFDHDWHRSESGELTITPRHIEQHKWEDKEIPSGFFFLPNAENVSAVIFSNSGTISKFNRIGSVARFGSRRVKMVRKGFAVDHDSNAVMPQSFSHAVNSKHYTETWAEGLDVFHNPRALIPLNEDLLPGAAHHNLLEGGHILSSTPEWHPLSSRTLIKVS